MPHIASLVTETVQLIDGRGQDDLLEGRLEDGGTSKDEMGAWKGGQGRNAMAEQLCTIPCAAVSCEAMDQIMCWLSRCLVVSSFRYFIAERDGLIVLFDPLPSTQWLYESLTP